MKFNDLITPIWHLGLLALLCAVLSSCSSRSSSPPQIDVSITTTSTQLLEDPASLGTIDLSLSKASTQTIVVELVSSGSATLAVDFELSETSITFEAGTTTKQVELTPVLDWVDDPQERVTLGLRIAQGNAQASDTHSSITITLGNGTTPANYKEFVSADLLVWTTMEFNETSLGYNIYIRNDGKTTTSPTTLQFDLRTDLRDSGTSVRSATWNIPAIDGRGFFSRFHSILLYYLEPNTTYYGIFSLNQTPEEISDGSSYGQDYVAFQTGPDGTIVSQCEKDNRQMPFDGADEFLTQQWHLDNTGQNAFASSGGTSGADLQMDDTLSSGPNGDGVIVAVVDTGLEICHPDLELNIEADSSYNFATESQWIGATQYDPYNPHALGDHGTSVAGIIGSIANNGIGGRGVAPNAKIRGYNFLSAQSSGQESSLGFSTSNPDSSDVDIFNMSYGVSGYQRISSPTSSGVFQQGTEQLRNGLGAIYVKSAGNGFDDCVSVRHDVSEILGCQSANGDPTNNLPYLLVVGGFNADDTRASYSSVGSNLWISAPSGEYGGSDPAIITTDQQGVERGYTYLIGRGLALDRTLNSYGNYVSTFNGTSSAAPNTAGAVAVLLSQNPNLTWRDVKYILATTARKIDPLIEEYRVAFGDGTPHILRHDWIENDAGYNFHNWYGFGAIALDDAVEMVRTYRANSLGSLEESSWFRQSQGITIPDYDSSGVESTVTISDLPTDANVEAVVIELNGSHEFYPDLMFTVESPNGTHSILNSAFNDFLIHSEQINWRLLSNAFYGESVNGEWKLKVVDAAPSDGGRITDWAIKIYYGTHPADL